jgi:beta-glucanase (GH16 family)
MWNGSDDNDWPDSGEIDIAEAGWNWGGGSTSLNTLHYGTSNWSSYDGQFHAQVNGGSTGIGRYEWHTYAVEWTPSSMTWFKDGGVTGSVGLGFGGQDFEHDHFILLNLAMGGAGGGSANAADSYFPKNGASYMWEQVMEIDYVRVDKLENSGGGGGGGGTNCAGTICCSNSCVNSSGAKQCGGTGCGSLPGGSAACCSSGVTAGNVTCNATRSNAPCIIR